MNGDEQPPPPRPPPPPPRWLDDGTTKTNTARSTTLDFPNNNNNNNNTQSNSNANANPRPHESSLGDLPTMESAPSSGNFAFPVNWMTAASTISSSSLPSLLPPPPPPPKVRGGIPSSSIMSRSPAPLSPTRSPTQSLLSSTTASPATSVPLLRRPPPPPSPPAGTAGLGSNVTASRRPLQVNTGVNPSSTGLPLPLPPPPKVIGHSHTNATTTAGTSGNNVAPAATNASNVFGGMDAPTTSTTTSSSQWTPHWDNSQPPPPPPPQHHHPLMGHAESHHHLSYDGSNNIAPALADELSPTHFVTKSQEGQSSVDSSPTNATTTMDDLQPPPRLPLTTFYDTLTTSRTNMGKTTEDITTISLLARRHSHIPILVVSTESAQRLAWKNGLQLIDMFQGIIHDLHLGPSTLPPFRSVHKSLVLSSLKVQFVEPIDMMPSTYQEAHTLLHDHAQLQESDGNVAQELIVLEDRVEELIPDPTDAEKKKDLAEVTRDAFQLTSSLDIPWLLRYRQALDASTNALPHDLIQCPPLILYVCSTEEVESPLAILEELMSSPEYILPACFRNGQYDLASIRSEVLVLHDELEGPSPVDDRMLRLNLQTKFGPQAQVLRINNVSKDMAASLAEQEDSDLWAGGGRLGNRLSMNDRVLFRRYFQTLLTSSLLPSLERRIATLNAIVNERKKGVRNLVKSFWRKPKDDPTSNLLSPGGGGGGMSTTMGGMSGSSTHSDGGAFGFDGGGGDGSVVYNETILPIKYRYDSIESQTRLLADTLFLMQDYENALSTYRLIRDDFKSDKALVHYANVQEMMGLCMYQMDPFTRAKDIFTSLESALLSYTNAAEEERSRINVAGNKDASSRPSTAPHATRLASRLCLLLSTASDILTPGRELEVADLLASASSHESSLGAAVLLEQSSTFYFESTLYRKYAFHMLMSGHMFRTAGQDHHAFRCFTSALYVYRHGQWGELYNHLKSALAAQLLTMERMSVALIIYAKLVSGAGKVSTKSQQKFLTHLLDICTNHPQQALAGADRILPLLVANNNNNNNYENILREREAIRSARLERIVDVVQCTKNASRVLELPHVGLPRILDKSVCVWTHSENHFLAPQGSSLSSSSNAAEDSLIKGPGSMEPFVCSEFGKIAKGDGEVWEELELMTIAESKAALDGAARGLDDTITAALSKITDPQHRRVIAQWDKEKQSRTLLERSRRNGSLKPKPKTRPRGEPIICDFVVQNPLAVDIHVTCLQLVAQMVREDNDNLCTNQDAIRFNNDNLEDDKQEEEQENSSGVWIFPSSIEKIEFHIPEFCRVTEKNQKASSSAQTDPYFVVTKRDLELKAGEEQIISAGLTPLVEGSLEILGVRCKLANQVWVYHPFDIPGPLLNDSRTNRANRVRGESLLLKSNIGQDMPCLTADLVKQVSSSTTTTPSDSATPLLQGQITNWIIRLQNVGNAPASNITLKTNLPWVNILTNNDHDSLSTKLEQIVLEHRATSNCLGPTGTLMKILLHQDHLQQQGCLHPGETIEIPIQIRPLTLGRQAFYMLHRYELSGATRASDSVRWLRTMYNVTVYPSLELSARVLQSSWKSNEQILSIEFTNQRTDQPTNLYVTLDKLALVSRHFRLDPLPGQFNTTDSVANVLQIGWQERMTVHYRVVLMEQASKICLTSECSLLDNAKPFTTECFKSENIAFLCLEQAWESFETSWKNHQRELLRAEQAGDGEGHHPRTIASIRRANTADSASIPDAGELELGSSHSTSIARLCPVETSLSEIQIICNWRAILGDQVIRGEHYLRNIALRPISAPAAGAGCPLGTIASYPSQVAHNFSKGPAIIPMKVTLRNLALESPVQFEVSLDVEHRPGLELIGIEKYPFSLNGNEEVTIALEAIITRAGIHNLQALALNITQEKACFYQPSQQWLVHVTDDWKS